MRKNLRQLLSLILLLSISSFTISLDNGLALTPPMGWNTWNLYVCDIDEALIRRTADRLVDLGLDEIGYRYVNLDDCWMAPNRTVDNEYVGDAFRFPSGMKALGDYLHSKNLFFGVYTSAGTKTCQGLPGSLGYETIDAQTFADWGVDYLKYDNCWSEDIPSIDRYPVMRDALNRTGRPIFYSLCQWGVEDSWKWAPSVGNAWRSTPDISRSWQSIRQNFWHSFEHAVPRSGKGAYADPDILEIGVANLTVQEQQSHFALWVMVKAPLLLAMDLDSIEAETLDIIRNKELIRVHQDPNASPAQCFLGCDPQQLSWSVFALRDRSGDTIALVINWGDDPGDSIISFSGQDVGVVPSAEECVTVMDLWTGNLIGTFDFDGLKMITTDSLVSHECAVYRFTTVPCGDTKVVSSLYV